MADLILIKVTLLLLSAIAGYCIVGLQIRNGFFDLLTLAGAEIPRKLPGSSEAIISKITGFTSVDMHLGELLLFFWPVVSGQSPPLSLFAFYMIGQILAVQTLVLIEGLRAANIRRIISYTTIWGVLYQSVPWGIVMPIYFAIYLWTSPVAKAVSPKFYNITAGDLSISPIDLAVLPIALIIGFIIPTTLTAMPPPVLTTIAQQQALLVFWQGFPVWIAICQYVLPKILSVISPSPRNAKSSHVVKVRLLRRVNIFSLSLTTFVHIVTIVFTVVPSSRPEYFISASRQPIDLKAVFLPMFPFSMEKVEQLTQGCLILLQYDMYFASGASVMWAVAMLHRIDPESSCWGTVAKALLLSLLVGPGGAALVLIWERDEKIFQREKGIQEKTEKAL